MAKYLNDSGLATVFTTIKGEFISPSYHCPYIVGTQVSSTNAWTGVATFASLQTGQSIRYKLPYVGTSTAATLTLTLPDNTTTSAISIVNIDGVAVTTQYVAGDVIFMTYDGTNWRTADSGAESVHSINGETGTVVLDADDIPYNGSQSVFEKISEIVAQGGEPNVIETVEQNGTPLTVTNKTVNVTVPTATSDLTNDSNFVSDANYTHIDVVDTYSSTGTDAVSGKGIAAALGTLDSSITAETNKAISAITITDGKITANSKISIPVASSTAPVMDGIVSPGVADTFSRSDHVHPTDTSRAEAFVITGTAVGGTTNITLNYDYDTILYRIGVGASAVLKVGNYVFPFLGSAYYNSTTYLAFGVTAYMGGSVVTSGYLLPEGEASSTATFVENLGTVPTAVSQLTNDSGYLTSSDAVTSFNGSTGAVTYTAPVTSVNSATGAVSLDATDIPYNSSQSVYAKINEIVTQGGEPNVIETVEQNGTPLTVTNKTVNVTVPTKTSDLTNDSGFTTNDGTVTSVATGTGLSGGTITTSGTISLDSTYAVSASDISTGTDTTPKLISAKTFSDAVSGLGGGTVTSVAISGTSPISASGTVTTSGTLSVSHETSGVTAKTTAGLYPFKVNATGHITEVGTAVTIPTVNDGNLKLQKNSGTASSIYSANQSADSTLKFTTTSVGSASGWSAGSAPTLGDAISADDITGWTTNTPTTIDTTKFNGGSFTSGSFSGGSFTQGEDTFSANTPTVIDTTKFNGGSFTSGEFSGGSFTQGTDSFTANTPTTIDTTKFSGGSFTQGVDSFTANTPTAVSYSLSGTGTVASPATLSVSITNGIAASFTQGSDSFTSASIKSGFYSAGSAASFSQGADTFVAATHGSDSFTSASLSNGFYSAGSAASFTQGTDTFVAATHASDTFSGASLGTGFYSAGSAASLSYTSRTIPNVTNVGSAPSLTITSTTVVNDITAL